MKFRRLKTSILAFFLSAVMFVGVITSSAAEVIKEVPETQIEETIETPAVQDGEIAAKETESVEVEAETEAREEESTHEEETETVSSESEIEETAVETKEVYADTPEEDVIPDISYRTHVQTFGWQNWVKNGAMSGTSGQAKRLEGINIRLGETAISGNIEYQTHVQSIGWQNWVKNGELSGTSGQAKRLEGIRIRLTGDLEKKYDVYYRVHAQTFGWLSWAKNGEMAGTSGLAKRLEGIEIVLVKKGDPAPGNLNRPNVIAPSLSYRSHSQTYGWGKWVAEGAVSGIVGEKKRMEALEVKLENGANLSGNIEYQTHVQSYGWMNWVSNGTLSGTEGKAKRVEALRVRLTGDLGKVCDVYYRVHVEGYGWLGWTKNGEMAGTSGLGLRIEAFQIRIAAKSGIAPVSVGGASKAYTGPGYYEIGGKTYYYYAPGERSDQNGWTRDGNGTRYYYQNGKKLTGWNYIDGLKYYFNSDGSLCQNVDNIIGVQSRYQICVNKQMNCITIYASDGANGYVIPVKALLCSTGPATPLGTFYTPEKYRWRTMYNGTQAQFATRLTAGEGYLFHSIVYDRRDNHTMQTLGYNGLGVVESSGCIRLICGEAYWIYTRCALGTQVIVYNSPVAGPFDRPVVAPIPESQHWDPSDPFL